jgi:hypothetical protein
LELQPKGNVMVVGDDTDNLEGRLGRRLTCTNLPIVLALPNCWRDSRFRGAALVDPHLLKPHAPNIACHGARHNRSAFDGVTERRQRPQFDNGSTTMPSSSLRESRR